MKTELIDKGDLSSELTIVIETTDYKPEFDKEIRKYSQKSQIKGFRKGKVPLSAIKKMYGKSVLADVIDRKVQTTLQEVITEKELDILGGPVSSEDQKMIDFDLKNLGDFEFKFDLGMAPEVDVKGADATDKHSNYKIKIEDNTVDEQFSDLRKRMGKQEDTDEAIDALDIVSLQITEVNSENEEPYTTEITIMPDRMTDAYKDEYLGKSKGYKGQIDVFEIEKDASEDYVRKYFLKEAPENVGNTFHSEVVGSKRLIPAEVNEEFFKTAFGGNEEIKDEASAKAKLREDLEKFYAEQGKSITKRYILESLIEKNEMTFPDAFLKRWLAVANDNLTTEQIENEYADFSKNLRWTLIKKEITKKDSLDVSAEDIRTSMIGKFKAQFAQYGYGAGLDSINYEDVADRMMQNQESVQKEYEELLAEKVLDSILESVTLEDKEVSIEEYKKIVEELQQNNA